MVISMLPELERACVNFERKGILGLGLPHEPQMNKDVLQECAKSSLLTIALSTAKVNPALLL